MLADDVRRDRADRADLDDLDACGMRAYRPKLGSSSFSSSVSVEVAASISSGFVRSWRYSPQTELLISSG